MKRHTFHLREHFHPHRKPELIADRRVMRDSNI
jgi:hypothetical protein